jgi:hypothetical protein
MRQRRAAKSADRTGRTDGPLRSHPAPVTTRQRSGKSPMLTAVTSGEEPSLEHVQRSLRERRDSRLRQGTRVRRPRVAGDEHDAGLQLAEEPAPENAVRVRIRDPRLPRRAQVETIRRVLATWPSSPRPKLHYSAPRTELRAIKRRDKQANRLRTVHIPPKAVLDDAA